MSQDQSVKDLKSRFEGLLAKPKPKPKPPLATKPASNLHPQADGVKPMLKSKQSVGRSHDLVDDSSETLLRTYTSGSEISDPFGSPLQSPAVPSPSGAKPPLPSHKPRFTVVSTSPDAFKEVVEVDHRKLQPKPTLSLPTRSTNSDTSRPSSSKPPPPPSPRVRSPHPRVSTEIARSPRIDPQNIFADLTADGDKWREEHHDTGLLEPDFVARRSIDDRRSSPPISRPSSRSDVFSTSELPVQRLTREKSPRPDRYKSSSPQPRSGSVTPRSSPPGSQSTTPTRQKNNWREGQKPALPSRPLSLHSSAAKITPIVEVNSPTLDEKPQLPRRNNTVESLSSSASSTSRDLVPRLPARHNTFQVGRKSMECDRRAQSKEGLLPLEPIVQARHSLDVGRPTKKPGSFMGSTATAEDSDEEDEPLSALETIRSSEQPDASTANRKPPRFKGTNWDIFTGKEVRKTALSGDLLVVAHAEKVKLHNLLTGEISWQLPVGDTKVTAMDFRTVDYDSLSDAGRFLWIGYRDGSIHELDVRNRIVVERYFHAHSGAVVAILRHGRAMWTLDEGGTLQMWSDKSATSLKGRPSFKSVRTVIGISAAIVIDGKLWIGSGRSVHVFDPYSADSKRVTPERGLESTRVTGLITCVVHLGHNPEFVYFGHDDGKISIYSRSNPKCLEVISISHYNLSGLLGVGDYLWASFKTGKIFVYDVHSRPWRVMKEWHAHKSPILELAIDRTSLWKEKRMQVSTMAGDGAIKIWDGLLMDDWLDTEMQSRIKEFSTFKQLSALICTWNAGASVPHKLSRDYEDSQFIEKMIQDAGSPDLIVFGFQELVDLDDKGKAGRSVAKGFFGKKKEKEPDEKVQAAAYLQWQNHLEKQVSIASSSEETAYSLLQVRSLVGLFTCVFVKHSIRSRIANVEASSVKTGLKGRYGNKGGIVIRFILDDTSMCFVNCHLAAGQKHVIGRNNDIFSILDQAGLSALAGTQTKNDVFVCGGDGSMVLDHEICILNGDLNYRINGNRSTVLQNIKEGRLNKLLENDQLLVELKKNATHRLRSFTESPIKFPPTYKFDPGTDNYDSSEKMRIPAWCDRVYYRGLGSSEIKCSAYQAHVCRLSDHRPVSALLSMKVKTIDHDLRKQVFDEVAKNWSDLASQTIVAWKVLVLSEVTGRSEKECREALKVTKGQVVSDAALALI